MGDEPWPPGWRCQIHPATMTSFPQRLCGSLNCTTSLPKAETPENSVNEGKWNCWWKCVHSHHDVLEASCWQHSAYSSILWPRPVQYDFGEKPPHWSVLSVFQPTTEQMIEMIKHICCFVARWCCNHAQLVEKRPSDRRSPSFQLRIGWCSLDCLYLPSYNTVKWFAELKSDWQLLQVAYWWN